jgi:pantetheine-phosphate adenylyltransferase
MIRALYPGTFDPIHNGHIDIATRASGIFDEVVLAVYDTPPKKLLFETDERVEMARQALEHLGNIKVVSFQGLTVECARNVGAQVIVRGLRNVADFEFEYQIGLANRQLAPDIELCCLLCRSDYAFLSATIVKEVAGLGGDVDQWVMPHVAEALTKRYPKDHTEAASHIVSKAKGKLSHHG